MQSSRYMGTILEESSPPLHDAISSVERDFRLFLGTGDKTPRRYRLFSPIPTKNVSDDLSREDLGLIGLTTRNDFLNISTSWL